MCQTYEAMLNEHMYILFVDSFIAPALQPTAFVTARHWCQRQRIKKQITAESSLQQDQPGSRRMSNTTRSACVKKRTHGSASPDINHHLWIHGVRQPLVCPEGHVHLNLTGLGAVGVVATAAVLEVRGLACVA